MEQKKQVMEKQKIKVGKSNFQGLFRSIFGPDFKQLHFFSYFLNTFANYPETIKTMSNSL